MAYQLQDLITTVRKRAKDTKFDADLITDFINETQRSVLNRSRFKFMEELTNDTASAGSYEFELYYDLDVILSLKLVDTSTDAVYVPDYMGYAEFYEDFDPDTAGQSIPTFYTVYGNTVVFNAPLSQSLQVRLKYLKSPITLAHDNDEPQIPEQYKELLLRGAMAHVEEYRGNFDIAGIHARKVEDLTEDMLIRTSLRQLAQPHKARFGRR